MGEGTECRYHACAVEGLRTTDSAAAESEISVFVSSFGKEASTPVVGWIRPLFCIEGLFVFRSVTQKAMRLTNRSGWTVHYIDV